MRIQRIVFVFGCLVGSTALAGEQYHVYKNGNGECEIDNRDHAAMKNQRSIETCLGHADSRTDAEKIRIEKVKGGACKCPTGETCS